MSKRLVITGGTSGIGQATVRSLVTDDWDVTILARNRLVGDQMISDFGGKLTFIYCDLADLTSVKKAADEIKTSIDHIDVLMNNAGGMVMEKQVTKDGFEMTFAMNHLGHFLLTTELMDLLMKSKSRVINVSSTMHKYGKLDFDDLQYSKTAYKQMKAYGDAKLCNIYFTKELHHRFHNKGISAFSCHPGVVRTNFASGSKGLFKFLLKLGQPFMLSPEQGARTQIYLATVDGVEKHNGNHFVKSKVAEVAPQAREAETAAHLWEVSEQLVAGFR